ncbi:MAG: hypothetical protein J5965_07030 [Aeriscardovia sp.]|nr:hypothetical protein [Aeriscardovia sp.]MBP3283559.1 hypothetical protein [Treponema sp.]
MKKLFQILLFNIFVVASAFATPLSYSSFVDKYNEANIFYSQKKYEPALEILNELVADEFSQTYPSVFLSRAMVLCFLERYGDAKTDIDNCISLQPYSLKPILCRSIINTGLKDYDSALCDVNYCLEKNPSWDEALHQRGLVYMSLSDYSAALADFSAAISNARSPKAEYFSDRGFSYYYLQDFSKAKEDFVYSLTISENDNVYLCLIDVCYKLQHYAEGIKYAEILISRGQRVDAAIIERSYIYLVLEKYDDVEKDLALIEKTSFNLVAYHKIKGIYYILTDDMGRAIEEIKTAHKLNPTDKDLNLILKVVNNESFDIKKILNSLRVYSD